MEKGKENRGHKVTDRQKRTLLEYMKQNPQLISGKFTSSFTLKDSVKEWSNLTDILNSIPGGATKDYKSWRKVTIIIFTIIVDNICVLVLAGYEVSDKIKICNGQNPCQFHRWRSTIRVTYR